MSNQVKHILIYCHAEDREDMNILMSGMAVHSNFIHWHLNSFYEEFSDQFAEGIEPPAMQVWHGFTTPGFAWKVLASLIASVSWKYEGAVTIEIEQGTTMEIYAPRQLFHAVREGKIK